MNILPTLLIVGMMIFLRILLENDLPTEKEARARILKKYPHLKQSDITVRREKEKVSHPMADRPVVITRVYLEYPLLPGSVQIAPKKKGKKSSYVPFGGGGVW